MSLAKHDAATYRTATPIPVRMLAALLVGAALIGGTVGGTVALRLEAAPQAPVAAGAPAATFDAAAFRAEERRGGPAAAPTFDAVGFRSGEREILP